MSSEDSPGRRGAGRAARFLVLLGAAAFLGAAPASDPVESLRQALSASYPDAAARDRAIQERLVALRSLGDLRGAIVLREWREPAASTPEGAADQANREATIRRFTEAVRDHLRRDDPAETQAVLELFHKPNEASGLFRPLGPDIAAVAAHAEPRLRALAARALGQINPDPAVAAPVLGQLLAAPEPALRLAAAEGLAGMMQTATAPGPPGIAMTPAARQALVATAVGVLAVAPRGLADWHPDVRRRCATAAGLAAAALARLTSDPPAPASGDKTEADRTRLIDAERDALRPLVLALRDLAPVLAHSLRDGDAEVQATSRQALEAITEAHRRWLRQAAALPKPAAGADDPLADGLRSALPALSAATADPEVRVRRAALDVLELLGPAGAPAMPALIHSLDDPDRFVRWSAARTLGSMGLGAADAIPALTRLLDDPDPDLRKAAAVALDQVGPARPTPPPPKTIAAKVSPAVGQTALPALLRSLRSPDPDWRTAALHALREMHADPRTTVPVLCEVLSDPEAKVRQAAAEALGDCGPAARDAVEPLRAVLLDSSPEVRRAAADALLAISPPSPWPVIPPRPPRKP